MSMPYPLRLWILKDRIAYLCEDVLEWGRFFENSAERTIALTMIDEDLYVSTVFLGIDNQFSNTNPEAMPLLFETAVFGAPMAIRHSDGTASEGNEVLEMRRYSTWGEAEEGHAAMVAEMCARFEAAKNLSSEGQAP